MPEHAGACELSVSELIVRSLFQNSQSGWHGKEEENMKVTAASLAGLALLGLIPAACHGQDFSAEVTYESAQTRDASSRPALLIPAM